MCFECFAFSNASNNFTRYEIAPSPVFPFVSFGPVVKMEANVRTSEWKCVKRFSTDKLLSIKPIDWLVHYFDCLLAMETTKGLYICVQNLRTVLLAHKHLHCSFIIINVIPLNEHTFSFGIALIV